MTYELPDALVLAFYPMTRGFAYVLFEGPLSPYDWGVKEVRGKNKNGRIVQAMKQIIERCCPKLLVLEDWTDDYSRRAPRIKQLYEQIETLAEQHAIPVTRYGAQEIKHAFANVIPCTKYEIALNIAKHIPAFSFQVPPVRNIWMSEDPRQALYDAAALGVTFFANSSTDSGHYLLTPRLIRAWGIVER
jgi:hypothetical protein